MLESSEDDENTSLTEDDQSVSFDYGIEDGAKVTGGGVITSIRKSYTKAGNKAMAVIEVEDLYGTFTSMLFPKQYDKVKDDLALDKIITITGKVNIRDGEKPIILSEKIDFWDIDMEGNSVASNTNIDDKMQEKLVAQKLYLKYNIEDDNLNNEIRSILSLKDGETPVYVQSNGKMFSMNVSVTPTTAMISELVAILGEGNLKIV